MSVLFMENRQITENVKRPCIGLKNNSLSYSAKDNKNNITSYNSRIQIRKFSSSEIKIRPNLGHNNKINQASDLLPNIIQALLAARPPSKRVEQDSLLWGQISADVKATLPSYPNNIGAKDGKWQDVSGTQYKFFVFSAFYERRQLPHMISDKMIRVIGATKTVNPDEVWCRMWYLLDSFSTRFRSITVKAQVKAIRENWGLSYSASYILCPLKSHLDVPFSVSIVHNLTAPLSNLLLLRNTDNDQSISKVPTELAVCVKQLYNFDQTLSLLEFLELYRILGVSHFTFYNHTIGPKAACILQHYIDGNIPQNQVDKTAKKITVDLLSWEFGENSKFEFKSEVDIRDGGTFASLNDCLYRNMYRYSYAAFVDLDEFLIPHHNDTLIDFLEWLPKQISHQNTGAYYFRNAFFYMQFENDDSVNGKTLRGQLLTQKKTRRRVALNPYMERSKYICKLEDVVEVGNHFVWEFCPKSSSLNIAPESGLSHHYRVCEFGGDDCVKAPSVVDRTAHKYGSRLSERINAIYEYLREPCNLSDLPPDSSQA